jgi:hypothetical protein
MVARLRWILEESEPSTKVWQPLAPIANRHESRASGGLAADYYSYLKESLAESVKIVLFSGMMLRR